MSAGAVFKFHGRFNSLNEIKAHIHAGAEYPPQIGDSAQCVEADGSLVDASFTSAGWVERSRFSPDGSTSFAGPVRVEEALDAHLLYGLHSIGPSSRQSSVGTGHYAISSQTPMYVGADANRIRLEYRNFVPNGVQLNDQARNAELAAIQLRVWMVCTTFGVSRLYALEPKLLLPGESWISDAILLPAIRGEYVDVRTDADLLKKYTTTCILSADFVASNLTTGTVKGSPLRGTTYAGSHLKTVTALVASLNALIATSGAKAVLDSGDVTNRTIKINSWGSAVSLSLSTTGGASQPTFTVTSDAGVLLGYPATSLPNSPYAGYAYDDDAGIGNGTGLTGYTVSTTSKVVMPTHLYAYSVDQSIEVLGDSIVDGVGDSTPLVVSGTVAAGWVRRWLCPTKRPCIISGFPGGTINELRKRPDYIPGTLGIWGKTDPPRRFVFALGTNDIAGGGLTYENHIENITVAIAMMRKRGVLHVGMATILPRVTSSDAYATEAGQTPVAGFAAGGLRDQINNWIRTTPLLDFVVDVCSHVANGSVWAANPSDPGHTYMWGGDGVHPPSVCAAKIAELLPPPEMLS